MDDRIALFVTTLATGALLVAAGWLLSHLARRAAAGTLKRNQLAGIRTSVTLSSDAAWRAAHRAAKKDSVRGARGVVVGGVLGAASGLLGFLGVPFSTAMTTFTVIALGSTAWLLIWTLRGSAVGQRAAVQAVTETSELSD